MKKATMMIFLVLGALMVAGSVMAAPPERTTIVDTAIAVNGEGSPYEGQFDTLIAAVLAADPVILETLSGKGQFTVFAPTDAAFEAIDLNPDNIGEVPQADLTEILLYHVSRGERMSEDVIMSSRIRTMNFDFLSQHAGVLNGYSNIIVPDVDADNGVIHVIDAVLLPE